MHICVHPGFLLEINFAFCACICLSFFFNAIIGLSCNCFFILVCHRCRFSHIYRAENSICYVVWRPLGQGGGGSAIYKISYHFNTYYRNFWSFTRTADYPHRPIIATDYPHWWITRTLCYATFWWRKRYISVF